MLRDTHRRSVIAIRNAVPPGSGQKRLPSLINALTDRLRDEWSLEQISGFVAPLKRIGVSHQWVYSMFWDDKARGGDLW